MNYAGWNEIGKLTKHRRSGKLRDTFRIYVNNLSWCKGRRDETGKEFWFDSAEELQTKLASLEALNYKASEELKLPTEIISHFATEEDEE